MGIFYQSRFTLDIPIEHGTDKGLVALYQTMTGAFVLIQEEHWCDIANGASARTDPDAAEIMYEQGFLVKDETDENAVFECWKQQHVHDFATITSKVLVTRKCNNRCRYCVLDPEPKEMSPETARAMDQFYIGMMEERNPGEVKDDYLGGEPLLNTRIILESGARRFQHCAAEGIEYGFTITTNGTLIGPSIISEMQQVGLTGIRVSMAGPAAVHDHLRPSKNNGATYDLIMENLQSVSGMVPITVECQYDSGALDYQRIPEMLDEFKECNIVIEDINFTPILPTRRDTSYNSGTGDSRIGLWLIKEAGKRGYAQDRQAPSNTCMADFRSKFVFDTDGSIIPCPSLQGGEMAYGHVRKGVDFVLEAQLLKRSLDERCLNECELLPICLGGCRLQALVNHKDFAGIDCQYETYRVFLEDYIKEKAAAALADEKKATVKKAE